MKIFILLFFLCYIPFTAMAAGIIPEGTPLAVMDFGTHKGAASYEIALSNAEGTSSEYIINRFLTNGNFVVHDKDYVKEKLKKAGIKTTGIIDVRQLKTMGEILGVKYIVYGNVNNVSASENGTNVASPLPTLGGNITIYTVDCQIIGRVIDIETGYIIAAARGTGRSRSSMSEVNALHGGIKVGTVTLTQESVHNAIQKAAYNTVDLLTAKLLGREINPKDKKSKGGN